MKDARASHRLAYSEAVMRLTAVDVALVFFGLMLAIGGLPRLSDGVAHASRCPASPRRTLRAENLGKPARRVMISAPWYEGTPAGNVREAPKGPVTGAAPA